MSVLKGEKDIAVKTMQASSGAILGYICKDSVFGLFDANGNEVLKQATTASAVNEITITPSATGNAVKLAATGGDTNVGLSLSSKGTGSVTLWTGDGAREGLIVVDTASAVNEITITPAATGGSVKIAATGGDSNVKLLLDAKGTSEVRINSRTTTQASGDFIGFQSKPRQGAASSGTVYGCQISAQISDTFALTGSGSLVGGHIDTYVRGTTGDIAGDVRGLQVEMTTDDAGARTISGNVSAIRIRSAFSATAITGAFEAIRIEKPETQTNSQTFDSVLTLTSTISGVWHDTETTATAAGFIKVLVNGNARYIQLYSGTPS